MRSLLRLLSHPTCPSLTHTPTNLSTRLAWASSLLTTNLHCGPSPSLARTSLASSASPATITSLPLHQAAAARGAHSPSSPLCLFLLVRATPSASRLSDAMCCAPRVTARTSLRAIRYMSRSRAHGTAARPSRSRLASRSHLCTPHQRPRPPALRGPPCRPRRRWQRWRALRKAHRSWQSRRRGVLDMRCARHRHIRSCSGRMESAALRTDCPSTNRPAICFDLPFPTTTPESCPTCMFVIAHSHSLFISSTSTFRAHFALCSP